MQSSSQIVTTNKPTQADALPVAQPTVSKHWREHYHWSIDSPTLPSACPSAETVSVWRINEHSLPTLFFHTWVSWALPFGFSGSSTAVLAAAMRLADLSRMSSAALSTSLGEMVEPAGTVAAIPRAEATSCFKPSTVFSAAVPVSSLLPCSRKPHAPSLIPFKQHVLSLALLASPFVFSFYC